MIQRIQSLWLFLAAALLLAVIFLPLGIFKMPHGFYECTAFSLTGTEGVEPLQLPVWLIGAFSMLAALLSFISIFLFKKRLLQIRFTKISLIVKSVVLLLMIGLFMYFKKGLDAWVGYGPAVLMPLLGIILDFMAIRGIKKDEDLVRSLDRIR
jgi:hypothetical protein